MILISIASVDVFLLVGRIGFYLKLGILNFVNDLSRSSSLVFTLEAKSNLTSVLPFFFSRRVRTVSYFLFLWGCVGIVTIFFIFVVIIGSNEHFYKTCPFYPLRMLFGLLMALTCIWVAFSMIAGRSFFFSLLPLSFSLPAGLVTLLRTPPRPGTNSSFGLLIGLYYSENLKLNFFWVTSFQSFALSNFGNDEEEGCSKLVSLSFEVFFSLNLVFGKHILVGSSEYFQSGVLRLFASILSILGDLLLLPEYLVVFRRPLNASLRKKTGDFFALFGENLLSLLRDEVFWGFDY